MASAGPVVKITSADSVERGRRENRSGGEGVERAKSREERRTEIELQNLGAQRGRGPFWGGVLGCCDYDRNIGSCLFYVHERLFGVLGERVYATLGSGNPVQFG